MKISIKKEKLRHRISPLLFAHNLEHTRSCVYQGLSAQILRNRKFCAKPQRNGIALEWQAISPEGNYFTLDNAESYTRHEGPDKMNRFNEIAYQGVHNVKGFKCGIMQDELALDGNKSYKVRLVLKSPQVLKVTAAFRFDSDCQEITESFTVEGEQWTDYNFEFVSPKRSQNVKFELYSEEIGIFYIGALSLLPADHFHGMRKDVIEMLKTIGTTMLRWPGGNFAGEYRWKDGLLHTDMRAPLASYLGTETQAHSHGYDYNELGINEFMLLCREIGAEPYITLNLFWDSVEESCEFLEYCNGSHDTKWGKVRAEQGFIEPFGIKFWSMGNEMGYGHMEGLNSTQNYTQKALDTAAAMKKIEPDLQLCASGPYPDKTWIENSLKPLAGVIDYVSFHTYCPSDDIDYTSQEAKDRMVCGFMDFAYENERILESFREQIDASIKDNGIKISFDEWNVWYAWYRKPNIGEGLFAGVVMHSNIKKSELLNMPLCCYFEPVNEGAIDAGDFEAGLTPVGQAFELLTPHIDSIFIDTGEFKSENIDVCASYNEDSQDITVTIVNKKPFDISLNIEFEGYPHAKAKEICSLISGDILPGNLFEREIHSCKNGNCENILLKKYSFTRCTFSVYSE